MWDGMDVVFTVCIVTRGAVGVAMSAFNIYRSLCVCTKI